MIPKIIHYCWLSNDSVPEELQNYMKTWKEKLPEYEFMLWNFDQFDKASSRWVSEAFDNKKYAFAADYIRLYAVYNYGGIYMDMDIEVVKNFAPLLDSPLMMAYEDDGRNGIEAGCFGAEKGNPVLKEILEYYEGRSFIKSDGSFDILPLPKIIYKYTSQHPELQIYDKDFFTTKSFKTGIIEKTKNTFTIHHFAGSWLSEAAKEFFVARVALYNHFPKWIAKILVFFPLCRRRLRELGFSGFMKKAFKKN